MDWEYLTGGAKAVVIAYVILLVALCVWEYLYGLPFINR